MRFMQKDSAAYMHDDVIRKINAKDSVIYIERAGIRGGLEWKNHSCQCIRNKRKYES